MYTWSDEWVSEGGDDEEEMAECIGVPASKGHVHPPSRSMLKTIVDHREIRDARYEVGSGWKRCCVNG